MFIEKVLCTIADGEQIGPLKLNKHLSVIFGKNAAGKTRTLNVLFSLSNIHKMPKVNIHGNWHIQLRSDKRSYMYKLEISRKENGKSFITHDSLYAGEEKLIFDRTKGLLLNETTKEEEPYTPIDDELSMNYVKDAKKYQTILEVRDYISQFKRLDYSMSKIIQQRYAPDTLTVDPDGTNLDTAILNLMNRYPQCFEKIKASFIEIFPRVEDIVMVNLPAGNAVIKIVGIKEDILEKPYAYFEAASGMIKILALFTILFSPAEKSLILIDELENSLDYLSLVKIGDIIKEVSLDRQVVIVTHSPTLANIFDLKHWIVAEREKRHTKFFNVKEDEDLRLLLSKNLENHELYTQDLLPLDEQG